MDFLDITIISSFFLGIGLAASAGFRVFLPLFALSLAAHFGFDLNADWAWVGSWQAIIALGVATLVEILGYFIPWVDNALDSIAIPLATVAGTLLMGISLSGMDSEVLQWGLAIIAGGGTAAAIKGTAATGRAASTATTAGTGNFVVSSGETAMATVLSVVTIALPIIGFLLVLLIFYGLYRGWKFFFKKKKKLELD